MQTVRLDISNDIFDKVLFFLENLPEDKIKYKLESPLFADFLNLSKEVEKINTVDREELHER